MSAQRRRVTARRSLACALSALALSACFAEVPAPRPGWTPHEIDAQRLCAAGQLPACGELGRLLVTHVTSEKDVNRGLVLLESSCGDGDGASCAMLGRIYKNRGDEKGLARATELLTRACDLRSAEGCVSMGILSEAWERHDARPVLEAYRRSCDLGSAQGCELYGFALRRHALENPHAADDAFIRACALGNLPSCHALGRPRIADPATRADGVAYLLKA